MCRRSSTNIAPIPSVQSDHLNRLGQQVVIAEPLPPIQLTSSDSTATKAGWLIEACDPQNERNKGRFLQLGTGQWCPAQSATVFFIKETAMTYAREFGYSLGHSAKVVRCRFYDQEELGTIAET